VVEGRPSVEIVKYAGEHGVDLIVMGTQGRSGLGRAFLGSVADNVIRQAECPVMVVRK
jgi:universal stress protein A